MLHNILKLVLSFSLFTTSSVLLASPNEVTIYSVYDSAKLDPIFKPFTEKTGIKVNIVSGTSTELITRLETEGDLSPADLHLDKDLVFHGNAESKGLYQPFKSMLIENNIPAQLIDSDKTWFTIVYRARVIMYNTKKVSINELSTYEDLGSNKWKGRLCVRTSNNSYNEGLAAFFIKHYGAEKTLQILKSWVNNFSVEPIKGDTDVINAVAAGTCDIAIANSYYLAPLVKADENFPVRPFFPNQNTTGAHINGVGIGLIKYSKNISAATKVMEYLSSTEVQAPVANIFSQYPSNPDALLSPILVKFGKFSADKSNIGEFSQYVKTGKELMREANYK